MVNWSDWIWLVTLIFGVIVGYMGQRSRFCTISGIRDYYMIQDPYRLKGLFGIIIGGIIGFSIVSVAGGTLTGYPLLSEGFNVKPLILIPLSVIGAFFLAFFSVMAEGCPFRQHVMAGEGRLSGMLYIAGLVAGVLFFDIVIVPYLQLFTLLG